MAIGRPPIEVDEDLIEKLASIHCTMAEIASTVGCSVDTLERRFAETIKRGKDKGKSSLRRIMWKKAQEGNPTMMIWLSKQHLGMSDKIEEKLDIDAKNVIKLAYKIE